MLLELFNTLLLCFAATEAVLRKPEKLSTFRTPVSVAIAVNVFLSEFAARALGSLSLTAAAVLHHVRGAVGTGSTALASCALPEYFRRIDTSVGVDIFTFVRRMDWASADEGRASRVNADAGVRAFGGLRWIE